MWLNDMFCTKCGNELKDGAAFCMHCGAPVKNHGRKAQKNDAPSSTVSPKYVEPAEKRANPMNEKKLKIVVLIAVSVILVAVVVFGVMYLWNQRKPKKNQNEASAIVEETTVVERNADGESMESSQEKEGDTNGSSKGEPKLPGTVVIDSSSGNGNSSGLGVFSSEQNQQGNEENATDVQNDGYLLPGSDSSYITMEDLKGFTAEECRIARNEIYARHGRKFDDEELQAYFDSKDWYHGTIEPDEFKEEMLNEYEFVNRDTIVEYEKKSGYR